jgi:uncharacterized membrane protein
MVGLGTCILGGAGGSGILLVVIFVFCLLSIGCFKNVSIVVYLGTGIHPSIPMYIMRACRLV